jgi:hypothetical protein
MVSIKFTVSANTLVDIPLSQAADLEPLVVLMPAFIVPMMPQGLYQRIFSHCDLRPRINPVYRCLLQQDRLDLAYLAVATEPREVDTEVMRVLLYLKMLALAVPPTAVVLREVLLGHLIVGRPWGIRNLTGFVGARRSLLSLGHLMWAVSRSTIIRARTKLPIWTI